MFGIFRLFCFRVNSGFIVLGVVIMVGLLFVDVSKRLEKVLKYVVIFDDVGERLKYFKISFSVFILVWMDDGFLKIFFGYWVCYDDIRGLGKGGVCYYFNVIMDEV